ncbi:MAG TPA: cytochrome c [Planctomycetota bacterium]
MSSPRSIPAGTEAGATRPRAALGLLVCGLMLACGCGNNMETAGRYKPLAPSPFFPDGRTARPRLDDTVARGEWQGEEVFFTGKAKGKLVDESPVKLSRQVLQRGQTEFNTFCSPCHGQDGYGKGIAVRRGFPPPSSFHEERLRNAPDGHFFDVMTNGFGVMYSYGSRVPAADRWAIVAYLRALQLSQHAALDDLSPEERNKFKEMPQ